MIELRCRIIYSNGPSKAVDMTDPRQLRVKAKRERRVPELATAIGPVKIVRLTQSFGGGRDACSSQD